MGAPVSVAAGSRLAARPAAVTSAGAVAPVTGIDSVPGVVSGAGNRTVEVWLAGRPRAAQRFVDAASTPGSGSYHRYLSPRAYSRRFGPEPGQVQTVRSYLMRAGFSRVRVSVEGDYVSATASTTRLERAFAVRPRVVTRIGGGPATMQASAGHRAMPAAVRGDILAVTGLDDARSSTAGTAGHLPAPLGRPASASMTECSRYWGQHSKALSPGFDGVTRAAVAVCGYSADQVRSAYGLGPVRAARTPTGTGHTIALIQGLGAPVDMFRALTDYAKANGLPRPRRGQYRQEAAGGSSRRSCDSQNERADEGALDSEAAYAMAPGADQLMVDGNGCLRGEQGLLDAELEPLTARASRPEAAIESVCYGLVGLEKDFTPSLQRVSHAIALRAAAEGVSLLFSSGDNPGVQPQADEPDATAVGGTTLGIGARGQRLFETGWSDEFGRRKGNRGPWHDVGIPFAAGGGASQIYGQPTYQQSVVPAALAANRTGQPARAVPDIAADGDSMSGMLLGSINRVDGKAPHTTFVGSGTSLATPLIAGMIADAEQGQSKRFGFLNPLLYSLAGSRALHDILPESPADPQIDRVAYSTTSPLPSIGGDGRVSPYLFAFDDQDPRFTSQVTAPGYDTITGLGSPNGTAFINALRSAQ